MMIEEVKSQGRWVLGLDSPNLKLKMWVCHMRRQAYREEGDGERK